MAEYDRVRKWINKNVDPAQFKTLEDYRNHLESLPGVMDKKGVIDDKCKENSKKYAFDSNSDLFNFKKSQEDAEKRLFSNNQSLEDVEALKKYRAELDSKIAKMRDNVTSSEDKIASAVKKPAESKSFVEKAVKSVSKFFSGIFGKRKR